MRGSQQQEGILSGTVYLRHRSGKQHFEGYVSLLSRVFRVDPTVDRHAMIGVQDYSTSATGRVIAIQAYSTLYMLLSDPKTVPTKELKIVTKGFEYFSTPVCKHKKALHQLEKLDEGDW